MAGDADEPRAFERMVEAAEALVAGVAAALPRWAEREAERLLAAWDAMEPDRVAAVRREAAAAGAAAAARVTGELAGLVRQDPADQRATPLEILRSAVAEPTAVLRAAGVPEVVRDRFAEERWPEDVYGLMPHSMRDLDEDLAAVHFAWGVARAEVHRARTRRSGPHR